MNTHLMILAAAALAVAPAARADEAEAERCTRVEVWEDYVDGWAVRTLDTTGVEPGGARSYLVNMRRDTEYLLTACGDHDVLEVELSLFHPDGELLLRSDASSRKASLYYAPEDTGPVFVVVQAREVRTDQEGVGVSLAVVQR